MLMLSKMDKFKVVTYDKKYRADFETLNRDWIERFFTMEEEDFNILKNPETYVINRNGEIFFALYEERVVGTAAMIAGSDGVYELAKMAVTKDFQRQGIGQMLLNQCIKFAKKKNAKEIFLITNNILKPALNLYASCGFVLNAGNDDERYQRGNTKMNLLLK